MFYNVVVCYIRLHHNTLYDFTPYYTVLYHVLRAEVRSRPGSLLIIILILLIRTTSNCTTTTTTTTTYNDNDTNNDHTTINNNDDNDIDSRSP